MGVQAGGVVGSRGQAVVPEVRGAGGASWAVAHFGDWYQVLMVPLRVCEEAPSREPVEVGTSILLVSAWNSYLPHEMEASQVCQLWRCPGWGSPYLGPSSRAGAGSCWSAFSGCMCSGVAGVLSAPICCACPECPRGTELRAQSRQKPQLCVGPCVMGREPLPLSFRVLEPPT